MHVYKCFWRGKTWECHADTTYQAQQLAASYWKVAPRKQYEIAVVLADKPVDPASL